MNPTVFCPRCNDEVDGIVKPRPDTPHEAEVRCGSCGGFIRWLKKEKNEGKRPRNRYTPESLGVDFCQMCRRTRNRLGKNEVLIPHHIIEIQEGGPDLPENIWVVCTPCHLSIHHQRTYLNDHFNHLWEIFEAEKERLKNLDLPPWEERKEIANVADQLGI
jgi:hypothetical protein